MQDINECLVLLYRLPKGYGVAHGKKMKKSNFVSLLNPPVTHECPQFFLAQSVQPFGRLYATYIRMSCFIILIT